MPAGALGPRRRRRRRHRRRWSWRTSTATGTPGPLSNDRTAPLDLRHAPGAAAAELGTPPLLTRPRLQVLVPRTSPRALGPTLDPRRRRCCAGPGGLGQSDGPSEEVRVWDLTCRRGRTLVLAELQRRLWKIPHPRTADPARLVRWSRGSLLG